MSEVLNVAAIQQALSNFAAAREWDQFHTPKNLAMALAGEAGELLAEFQWLTPQESAAPTEEQMKRIRAEMADVLIHLLRLADKLEVNLSTAIESKLAKNAEKYPPELARGSAEKSTRLG